MSLLDTVLAKLTADGIIGSASGYVGFIGYAPDTQDQMVSMDNTGGQGIDSHTGGYTRETIQVRVRASTLDYVGCEAKWRAVFDSLQNYVSGNLVMLIAMNSGPVLFYDTVNRPNMTVNFMVRQVQP